MDTATLLDPDQWAEQTFGAVHLRDGRRAQRAVNAAGAMVRDPAASLPQQQHTWKAVKVLYRWLNEPDVTFAALLHPHWEQTCAALSGHAVALLVQDTTELDFSSHGAMTGLGQTVLAVLPETRAVVGCLAQRPVVRVPAPPRERRYQRRHRAERETDIWLRMVEQVGPPTSPGILVHVGDRGADMLPLFRQCRWTQTHFVVRAAQNRRGKAVDAEEPIEGEAVHLLDQVRSWPSQTQRPFDVPASRGRRSRQALLQLSFGPVTLLPPWNDPPGSNDPLPVWAVRVWETHPPADEEAIEGSLLTSLETQTCVHALPARGLVSLPLDRGSIPSMPQNRLPHRGPADAHRGTSYPLAGAVVAYGRALVASA
jgi:Transposase DNA-binding